MIIVEIVRWKLSSPSQNLSSRNTSSTINISSRIRIPSEVVEVIHLIAIFLFGAACTEWATDFGKYFIGRLRYAAKLDYSFFVKSLNINDSVLLLQSSLSFHLST